MTDAHNVSILERQADRSWKTKRTYSSTISIRRPANEALQDWYDANVTPRGVYREESVRTAPPVPKLLRYTQDAAIKALAKRLYRLK